MRYLLLLLLLVFTLHPRAGAQKPELILPIGHTEPVTAVAYFPDGTHLVSGSEDKQVKLWKADGRLVRTLRGHRGTVHKISVSPTGAFFLTIARQESILWNGNGDRILELPNIPGADRFSDPHRFHAKWSPDGSTLILSKGQGMYQVDPVGQRIQEIPFVANEPDHFEFSADSEKLYAITETHIVAYNLRRGDVEKLARIRKMNGSSELPALLRVGDKFLYAAYRDGEVVEINLRKKKALQLRKADAPAKEIMITYQAMSNQVSWIRWTVAPDGSHVCLSTDYLNSQYKLINGQLVFDRNISIPDEFEAEAGIFYDYPKAFAHPTAIDPSGRYTLWRIRNNTGALVYDQKTDRVSAEFRGLGVPESFIGPNNFLPNSGSSVTFSPTEPIVLVGGRDGLLRQYALTGVILPTKPMLPVREIIWVDTIPAAKTSLRIRLDDDQIDNWFADIMTAIDAGEITDDWWRSHQDTMAPLFSNTMNVGANDYQTNAPEFVNYDYWRQDFDLPELGENIDSTMMTNQTSAGEPAALLVRGVEDPNVQFWLDNPNPGSYFDPSSGNVYLQENNELSFTFKASESVADVGLSPGGKFLVISHSDAAAEVFRLDCLTDKLENLPSVDTLPEERDYVINYGSTPRAMAEQQQAVLATCRVDTLRTPNRSFIRSISAVREEALLSDGSTLYRARLDGSRVDTLEAHRLNLIGAKYIVDDRFIVSWAADRSLVCWEADGMEPLFTLFFLGKKDWVATTPTGLFDASPGAMNSLSYSIGREILDLGQLKERYYEPGLMPKLMGLAATGVRPVEGFRGVDLFPEVTADIKRDTLQIRLNERNGGIGRIAVFVNGKEVVADLNPVVAPGQQRAPSASLPMLPYQRYFIRHPDSTNIVSVVAYNQEGWLKSQPVDITYRPALSRGVSTNRVSEDFVGRYQPKFYAITIGTRDYTGEELDLAYPDKDAMAMAIALKEAAAGLFTDRNSSSFKDSLEVHCLSTSPGDATELKRRGINWQSSTKANVGSLFHDIGQRAKAEDVIVVYFSGHGIAYGNADQAKFYYLTQQIRNGNLSDNAIRNAYAISTEEITTWLNAIPALKQVLVIDACNSGTLVNEITSGTKNLNGDQLRAIERMKDRTGMFVISGSAADKVSYETSEYGQGLLTYALIQGIIRGGAASKYVDVMTLLQYATDEVPNLARNINKIQTPRLGIPQRGASFDIGLVDRDLDIPLSSPKPFLTRSTFLNQETYRDDAKLAELLAIECREIAADGFDAELLYADVGFMANGYTVNGLYAVGEGGKIKLSARLFRGETLVATIELPEQSSADRLVSKLLDRLLGEIAE